MSQSGPFPPVPTLGPPAVPSAAVTITCPPIPSLSAFIGCPPIPSLDVAFTLPTFTLSVSCPPCLQLTFALPTISLNFGLPTILFPDINAYLSIEFAICDLSAPFAIDAGLPTCTLGGMLVALVDDPSLSEQNWNRAA